jgi:dolichyl-diphosphooligosaccharide--protein glycosyltransferase
MSRETATVDSEADESTASSVLDVWRRRYDVVGLVVVMAFMLYVRVQSYGNLTRNGRILFSGNDAYYHFREISYVVENFPWTMPFDPWTGFPYGTTQGQFGTLYDQLVATVAMVIGLGDPSQAQVAMVTALAPAVMGTLVVIPVYYMGRRIRGRGTGLFAALLLAVMPGEFLQRSTVGFADHQVAEVLFVSIAVLALMVALAVAQSELPVYEQVLDRDWDGLKRPTAYAAAAGFALSLYLWVWPPGLFLVGILGIFFSAALAADVVRGRSPDHVASVGVVSMAVVALFMLVILQETTFVPTTPSLIHPLLAVAVGVWCAFLAGLARVWEGRELPVGYYPLAVAGTILAGFVALAVVAPSLFGSILNNIQRAFLFGQSGAGLTIAEAQPTPGASLVDLDFGQLTQYLFREYGFVYVLSLLSLAWLVAYTYFTEYRSEYLFLIIWTAMTWLMALSQVRFHYYLVLPLVLVTAWAFARVVSMAGIGEGDGFLSGVETYQVLTVLVVLMLVFVPLFPPVAVASLQDSREQGRPMFVLDAGRTGPSGANWAQTGSWMTANTPDVGMEYYGTYDRTDDFEYPESAYGVMAWWDYGHWITVLSERIPHANPFQQNARSASSFFQAPSERRANAVLEAIPSMPDVPSEIDELTTDELEGIVANQSTQRASEDVRYVMIDDQTAATKFGAITRWSDPANANPNLSRTAYFERRQYQVPSAGNAPPRNRTFVVPTEEYEDTMLYRLYYEDASDLEHYRLVRENNQYALVGGLATTGGSGSVPLTTTRRRFQVSFPWSDQLNNISRAAQQLETAGRPLQFGQVLPRFRGVLLYDTHVESVLKTYERVPGARVTGRLENTTNTTVVVELQLQSGPGRTFEYHQVARVDDDGEFETTVPYPTDDAVGPGEGGTDTNVTAVGNYSVFAGLSPGLVTGESPRSRFFEAQQSRFVATQFDVSERAIYDGSTVDLGEFAVPTFGNETGGTDGASGGDGTDGSGDGGNDGGNDGGRLVPDAAPDPTLARTG